MADESAADDQALYDVWDRLEPEQIDALHTLVDHLGARLAQGAHGDRPGLRLIAALLVVFRLGHLPVVIAALELEDE